MKHRSGIVVVLAAAGGIASGTPEYTITDLGIVQPSDAASQGYGISPGGIAFGRSFGSPTVGFTWTSGTGIVGLPNDPTRGFGVANGANDLGLVVGTGATTAFGSGAVPLVWNGGVVSQLPTLPGAGGVGRANDVNDAGVAVGSNGGGSGEVATYWSGGLVNHIAATTAGGATMTTAFRVNNAGIAVGHGLDPNNLARNVALMYDINTGAMTEVPALAGDNGGIAFDVSENGYVVGSSSFNQSGSVPFIWSDGTGTAEVPLPTGASSGSARGVNSDGWVVGTASSAFALPFLYDGTQTYLLQDLLPAGTGWDLATNTSSSALGIAEDGSIVGTGIFNGATRAYIMTPVPAPTALAFAGAAGLTCARRRR